MTRPRRTPFLCPECGKPVVWVRETRVVQGALRRRRQCDAGHTLWTKEVIIPRVRFFASPSGGNTRDTTRWVPTGSIRGQNRSMHPTVPATSRRTGLASSGPVCRLACSRGHIYTEENTRYMKGGGRGCRQCDHLYRQAYREARAGRSLSRPAPRLSDSEGFWSNVWLDDSGCWLWLGSLTDDGYGRCTWDNKRQRAHRVSWQVVKGPVPDGFVLDHLCRVRNCVNPAHLEPVTNRENVRRGLALGSKCRNGHDTADAIAYRDGRKACRTCARDRNRTYRSVASPDGRS